MFTTASSLLAANRPQPVIIDSKHTDSVFNAEIPYSPLFNFGTSSSATSVPGSENQFKSELMERIKFEAKRLNKRRQMNLSSIVTTSNITNSPINSDNSNSSPVCSPPPSPTTSRAKDQENQASQTSKLKELLNEMNIKRNYNKPPSTQSQTTSTTQCSTSSAVSSSASGLVNDQQTATATATHVNSKNVNISSESGSQGLGCKSGVIAKANNSKHTHTLFNSNTHNDLPIFSMNQVNTICERMLKEREMSIREQYDKILTQKLSEQYDSFVRFTHEQIQRRFENSQCSYVS